MTLRELTRPEVAELIGVPFAEWRGNCHGVSLAIVQRGLAGPDARVARGFCAGVRSQHSWIAASGDCYDRDAPIVDPTLWCHRDDVRGIWYGTLADGLHVPHGAGSIWEAGRPRPASEEPIALEPRVPLSPEALSFLALLGPLDRRGWMALANLPVGGWPAGEILAAMDDTPALSAVVPIDRIGMLTDRNPGGLYR